MSLHFFDSKEQLFLLLSENNTVLTPNNRMSESILQQYCIKLDNKIAEKPNCMPFRISVIKAYEQLIFNHPNLDHPTLLNKLQCIHIWRQMIKSQSSIAYSEGLLQSIMSAWERCLLWQVPIEDSSFHLTNQTYQFQKWWQSVEKHLNQENLITEHQLIPYLIRFNESFFSKAIVWACFDDFTPQQLLLQGYLTKKGQPQYYYDIEQKRAETQVLAAQDNEQEYQQLLAWLDLKVKEGNQRIGVVVPDLEKESTPLQRILMRHFEPTLFNISLGQALCHFPLISHALCWLNIDTNYVTHHQVCLLLQSPYVGGSKEEFLARSEYLQKSNLLNKQLLPLKNIIEELRHDAPQLAELLSNITPYPKEATIHEWIHLFQERLNSLGFPGNGLSSENFQCFTRFTVLFDELRQLALLSFNFSLCDAIEALQCLTENTIFQAQKTNAVIQISGLLEASGCEFDSLWIMGLTEQCLPQKVQLSAFIPPQLQRHMQMPHSLPERELQFAQHIIHRLKNSAETVVFSYPQLQDDHSCLPCYLIKELPPFVLLAPISPLKESTELMILEEQFIIPLLPEESITGGTSLLTNQAKCPFKAFAQHRLSAKASIQTTDGLDNKERGHIIHKIMELLWLKLETQHTLIHSLPSTIEQYVDEVIEKVLTALKQKNPYSLTNSIKEIEFTRLKRLVKSCLEWEKERPPFTIEALEKAYTINLAGLDFNVRVDRLDKVGVKKWVIDYKSSLPTNKPWNEDRPKESQLLLYALLDKDINTLLLLELKKGKIVCAGFSEEQHKLRGITSLKKEEDWDDYRDNWSNQLTSLALEFKQGYCQPQPTHSMICQQCDFQNLCRFKAEE